MFERIKAHFRRKRGNAALIDALLGSITEAARNPVLYTRCGVADTVWGRFEMVALHVFLFQHRAKAGGEALQAMAQELVDAYFTQLDSTLRELGIGDASVPKRMKKIGRMVYGRWTAYDGPLSEGDRAALADALRRNAYAEGGDASAAEDLAAYSLLSRDMLSKQPDSAFLAGRIAFADHVPSAVSV